MEHYSKPEDKDSCPRRTDVRAILQIKHISSQRPGWGREGILEEASAPFKSGLGQGTRAAGNPSGCFIIFFVSCFLPTLQNPYSG